MSAVTAFALVVLLLACLHETGRRLDALLPDAGALTAAECTALGMAAWVAAGGLLNSVDAARPAVLGVLAATAIAAAVLRALHAARHAPAPLRELAGWWPIAPLLVVVCLRAAFAMPTAVLNLYDDLRNYLVLPYRMLGTGTLAGSAFDSLGVDALGGLSFLQGLVLMVAPAGFAPLFDTLFGLLLAGLLLEALGRRLGCPAPLRALAQVLLVALDAQLINLSAVYSSAALVLALLLLAVRVVAGGHGEGRDAALGAGVRAGLLGGALCALKMPHALFALLLMCGLWALLAARGGRGHGVLGGAALGSGALVVGPWLAVAWRTHGDSVTAWLAGQGAAPLGGTGDVLGLLAETSVYAVSAPLDYLWLLLLAALCVAGTLAGRAGRAVGGVLAVAWLAVSATLLLLSVLVDAQTGARLLAALVIVVSLACMLQLLACLWRQPSRRLALAGTLLALLAVAMLARGFAEEFRYRARSLVDEARLFQLRQDRLVTRDIERVIGAEAYRVMRWLQQKVPAGAGLMALTGPALHLDFARNPVVTVHGSAFGAPWTPVPAAVDGQRLADLLAETGVTYLLLQDSGIGVMTRADLLAWRDAPGVSPAMRRLFERELAFKDALQEVAAGGELLYEDPPLRLIALPR